MTSPSSVPDGVLLVDKHGGVTSHDVVDQIRRGCRRARVGHTGTLDPMATGLMLLCVGKATRLQRYLTQMDKRYTGEIRFGFATTTYDAEGERCAPEGDPASIDPARLEAASAEFLGELDQISPPYSAKKIGGKRFYELARKGEEVPRVSKTIRISRFTLSPLDGDRATFTVDCSAGTYVRTIAHDLGVAVGVGAHVSVLRRTRIGPFETDSSITAADWLALPAESRFEPPHFVSIDQLPLPFPRVVLDARQTGLVGRGQKVLVRVPAPLAEGSEVVLAGSDDRVLAIGEVASGDGIWVQVQPRIVLGAEADRG